MNGDTELPARHEVCDAIGGDSSLYPQTSTKGLFDARNHSK